MPEARKCSFCGNPIEIGTGKMFVRKDGTIFYFCKNKCQKNMLELKRVPHRTRWTTRYTEMKAVRMAPEKKEKVRKKKTVKRRVAKKPKEAEKPKKKPPTKIKK